MLFSAVVLGSQLFAIQAFADWTWRDPLPQGNSLSSVAYSPALDTAVAFGDFGACVRKSGPAAWASVTAFSSNASLSSVVWANSRFVAVGGTAGVWTSADGTTWTPGQSGVTGSQIAGQTGRLAILSSNLVWISADATAWTSIPLPAPPAAASRYRALAFLGGTFVATGDAGIVARSTDGGATWSAVTSGFASNFYYLAAGSGNFVTAGWYYTAGGVFTPQVIHSTDGLTWAAGTIPTGNYLSDVVPTGSVFLATGGDGRVYSSSDGAVWAALAGAPANFYPAATADAGLSSTVVVGNRGGIYQLSPSLVWTRQTSGAINGTYLWLPRFSAAALGSLVLAKDDNRTDPAIYRSDDAGVTWTEQSGLSRLLKRMTGLAKSGARIVGYSDGDGGVTPPQDAGVYSTTNGTAWQIVSPSAIPWSGNSSFLRVNSLASNPSESVTLALTVEATFDAQSNYISTRKLYSSTAWGAWSPVKLAAIGQLPPQENSVETVFWDGSQFVMLLYPGRIFTSPDGLKWTQLPALPKDSPTTLSEYVPSGAPAANTAFSVASTGSLLVVRSEKLGAKGANGNPGPWENGYARFFSYVKGKWQENSVRISSPSSLLNQICWDGSAFLAPVPGRLLTSSDAITWTEREVGASFQDIVRSVPQLVGFTTETAVLTHPAGATAVVPSARIVAVAGGEFDASVTSTTFSWSAVSNVPWLSPSQAVGVGDAVLRITALPNKTTMPRSGVVTVGGETLTVTQPTAKSFQPTSFASGNTSVTIPFSGTWTASSSQSWATFPNGTTGQTGSGNVKISFAANPLTSSRAVTVTCNGLAFVFTQAGNAPAASYSGAVGLSLEPLTTASTSIKGSLAITVSTPTAASPDGAYSATLNVFHAASNLVFRAKGNMAPGGTLQNATWSTGGNSPVNATVSLAPLTTGGAGLDGSIRIADQTYAALAGKQIYSAKSNPWPASGSVFTITIPDQTGLFGTGTGTVAISADGVAKIAARLNDGTPVTISSPVWGATGVPATKNLFFYSPLANNLGFVGGWLASPGTGAVTWLGGGTWKPTPAGENPIAPAMSPYAKPAPNVPAVTWPSGSAPLNIYNIDFLLLGGNATISSANKLTVVSQNTNVTTTLSLNTATGAVTGQCSYIPLFQTTKATAKIYGVIDQPSNKILGVVLLADGKFGDLEIRP